jgi:hypothetical protein
VKKNNMKMQPSFQNTNWFVGSVMLVGELAN